MTSPTPAWEAVRTELCKQEPSFYELEPGGALGLALDDDWMLEVTPDGRLICQTGMAMEDIQSLLADGTPEDLNTDELAKQAKYYLQPAVSSYRATLLQAGFQEATEMNDQYVATTFQRAIDFRDLSDVLTRIQWCKRCFTKG